MFRFALAFILVVAAFAQTTILTPKPGPEPRINGPKVYGVRPGRPLLYRIPCTGKRPMKFEAQNLPSGVTLDAKSGIITGLAPVAKGEYKVTLRAENSAGTASRELRFVVGDHFALTPPMGWNDWYSFYERVSAKDIKAAADAMISSGMADFGYSYVSIDDCWMVKPGSEDPLVGGPVRAPDGSPLPNKKFPDMRALTIYIHNKGLKAGIYTSPGPLTCQKYEGAWQHEEIDAKTFAGWGFDLLKYDWCGYSKVVEGQTLEDRKRPYEKMGAILKSLDRDIVYNLCQYGMSDVWTWGGEVGGNSWRTTGDLGLEKDTELPGFYSIAFKNAQLSAFAGPGRWNDPDYILIGYVGNASKQDAPKKTSLTPDEQYSYMSLWSLMSSPLFFSGDVTRLDDFTKNILCNAEVIDVNQDVLGKQAAVIRKTDTELILSKPLEDGSLAVGFFNLSKEPRSVKASWEELGAGGRRTVRDLWRQRNESPAENSYAVQVAPHGVHLVRLSR